MAKVTLEILVCEDCYILIGTGDATSFDYYYGERADERLAEVEGAIDKLAELYGYLTVGSEESLEFSHLPCDCCKSHLAGSRHHVIALN
jgi:hypothetical protein